MLGCAVSWSARASGRAALFVVALAAILVFPSVALGTPPTLTSAVWQPGAQASTGTVSAAWSLPPEFSSELIEVGSSQVTAADGRFRDMVNFAPLTSDQTSWSWTTYLQPGTYYVHVSDCPTSQQPPCPSPEWSNILSFVVPQPSPPPSQQPPPPPPPSGGAQHTVTVNTTSTRDRRGKRATQLVVDVVGADEPPEVEIIDAEGFPSLAEPRTVSPTRTVYTHRWSCEDGGRWRWKVTSRDANGAEITRRGEYVIPRCRQRRRYVTRRHARQTVTRDLGAPTRFVRCAAGRPRHGQRAAVWLCTIRRPGYVCTGTLVLRFSELVQAGGVAERRHKGSGEVNCVR